MGGGLGMLYSKSLEVKELCTDSSPAKLRAREGRLAKLHTDYYYRVFVNSCQGLNACDVSERCVWVWVSVSKSKTSSGDARR